MTTPNRGPVNVDLNGKSPTAVPEATLIHGFQPWEFGWRNGPLLLLPILAAEAVVCLSLSDEALWRNSWYQGYFDRYNVSFFVGVETHRKAKQIVLRRLPTRAKGVTVVGF